MAIKLTERYFIIFLVFVASAYSQRNKSELENDVSAMKKLLAVQNSKIARLEEIADRCISKLSLQSLDGSVQLSKSWSDREQRQEEQRIPRFIVPSFSTIAFYAYKSRNFENVTIYQTMIYDTVVTNAGGAYDSNTGVFLPPESGVYGFSWTILVSSWKNINGQYGEIAIEIMQSGVSRGTVHADTERHGDDDSSTGFVILTLSSSDTVYLRSTNYTHDQGSFISSGNQERWTFSGFRIG